MKKFFKIILVLALIAAGIYFYDIYSGYKLTESVNEIISMEESDSQSKTGTTQSNAKDGLDNKLYSSLSDEDKEIYDSIYNALINFKSTAFLKNAPESERVFDIMQIVLSEHPEIFWTKGDCSYSSAGIISPKYFYTEKEAEEKSALIEKKVQTIISGVTGDEYSKSLSLFEHIVSSTQYDSKNQNNLESVPSISTIEGVFLNNKAVCTGYAKAYQYLLRKVSVQSICVTGEANNGSGSFGHAWVCQQINGEYYFSDPTWSDGYTEQSEIDIVNHDYFCITSKEIEKTHFLGNPFKCITASSNEYNYFVKEKRLFDKYNLSSIKKIAKKDIIDNRNATEIKFSNYEAYASAKKMLFDNSEVYSILTYADPDEARISNSHISYNSNDNTKTIMLIYTYK